MPDSPWQRAYEENASTEAQAQRAEELQSNAESAGVMGAAGAIAAGILGPMAIKGGARKAIASYGRAAARSGKADDVVDRASKVAKEADDTKALASQTSLEAGSRMKDATERASGLGKKAAAAARRQHARKSQGKRVDLSEFFSDVGFKAPKRLNKRAQAWRAHKRKAHANNKTAIGELLKGKEQRSLLSSASANFQIEQAAALPAAYAADRSLGLTGAPSDRAMYDVPGHVQDFVEYMPTYAAYETAGAAVMGAPRAAKQGLSAASEYLKGNGEMAAKAVSKTFDSVSRGADLMRSVADEAENRYNRVKTTASSKIAQRGYQEARGFLMDRKKGAAQSVERFLERRSGGSSTQRNIVRTSSSLRGAKSLFDRHADDFTEMAVNAAGGAKDATARAVRSAKDKLFVGEGTQSNNAIGSLFGGEPVRAGDIGTFSRTADGKAQFTTTAEGINLTQEAEREMARLKEGIDTAKANVQAQSENITDPGAMDAIQSMEAENLRVSGYQKIGGEIMRMPTGEDLGAMAARGLNAMTSLRVPGSANRGGVAVSDTLGIGTLGRRSPDVEMVKGSLPIARSEGDDLAYFGEVGRGSSYPQAAEDSGNLYRRGLKVKQSGFGRQRIYGQNRKGRTEKLGDFFVSGKGKDKAYQVMSRKTLEDEQYMRTRREEIREDGAQPQSFMGRQMKSINDEHLRLGKSEGGLFQRARDLVSSASPRRLFAEDSKLWSTSLSSIGRAEEGLPVADAVNATRQALVNSTDAYKNKEMFSSAVENLTGKDKGKLGSRIEELGGVDAVLNDEKKALKAAESVLDNVTTQHTDPSLKAPTTAKARRIIDEAGADPDSLHNRFGEKRGDTLRRFIFEQGALGTANGKDQLTKMTKQLDRLASQGKIKEDIAKEAKVGLTSLDMQMRGGRMRDPYAVLSNEGTQVGSRDHQFQKAHDVLRENRSLMEEFARSRPRVDVQYQRDAYTTPDNFQKPYEEANFFAAEPKLSTALGTYAEAGMDTMRRALGEAGMGWSPQTSLTTSEGRRQLAQTWTKRAGAAIGASFAYRLADQGLDIAVPDDAPLGEGITQELADIAANARLSASYVYDTLGITDAAQYMEGLAPKSTSILPGAAAGAYATGSILGAVAGATINRAMQPLMKDTPFESLSVLPPLAPFVSDMAEEYETTKEKYEGRRWIPQRKGRFFMLSSTPYAGGRIESYRPNWYTRQESDYEATPVKYGSKMEQMIFEDLPLIDFAPGDLIDPQYLQKKHQCLTPDSIVIGEDPKPISEVEPGDRVFDRTGQLREVEDVHVRDTNENVYRLNVPGTHHPIEVTGNHRVLVRSGGGSSWKRADELEPGDEIAYPHTENTNRDRQSIRITELTDRWFSYKGKIYHARAATENSMKAAYIKAKESWPKGKRGVLDEMSEKHDVPRAAINNLYRVDEDQWDRWTFPNDVEIDARMARLLGYYLAEGAVSGDSVEFAFDASEADTYAQEVVDDAESYGWTATKRIDSVEGNGMVVSVSSCVFAELVRQLVGRAKEKRVPGVILESPQDIQLEFLRAYLNGDGTYRRVEAGNRWCISYTTVVRRVAYGVRQLLVSLGLYGAVKQYDQVDEVRINGEYHGSTTGTRFRGVITGWHAERLSGLLDLNTSDALSFDTSNRGQLKTNDQIFLRLRSIEERAYEGKVYDLTVDTPGEGNYLTTSGIVHNSDRQRPYASPDVPFSEMPLIGPTVGATVGQAYNAIHPMASNAPTGMANTVGAFDENGQPAAGTMSTNGVLRQAPTAQRSPSGGAYMSEGKTVVQANSMSASFDEQLYRASEAMGFKGFLMQTGLGGEGMLHDARMPSASNIDSEARAIHDLQMGDMLGVGEALRRLHPYEREGKAAGPKNNMPEWMDGTGLQRGDPYCLTPETLIEVNEELIPAEEAYERVQSADEPLFARTHTGDLQPIEAADTREVDEPVTRIGVDGLPFELSVTDEHPVLVYDEEDEYGEQVQWRLAGDVEEGDVLLEPVGPDHEGVVMQHYDRSEGHPYRYELPYSGETARGLIALRGIAPPEKDRFATRGLSTDEEFAFDAGLQLSGSKYNQRQHKGVSRLRRRLEEKGLPETIVGGSIAFLRELVRYFGEVDRSSRTLHIPVTEETVRPEREEWTMRTRHEPERSAEETARQFAYTLLKALAVAGTMGDLERTPDGFEIVLAGLSAAKYLFTQHERYNRHAEARQWKGTPTPDLKRGDHRWIQREVVSVDRPDYEGPVYAFQVAEDSSFVAAGLATHNSQVAMGEVLLPGEGLEATGALTGGDPALEAENVGRNTYDTALRTLDIRREEDSWAKDAVTKRLKDAGAAVRAEAVYVDEQTGMTAVADAATKSNQPIDIQAVGPKQFEGLAGRPRQVDRERLNATLGAANKKTGMLAYVNEQTGEVQTFSQEFDSQLYNSTISKLQQGQQMAKEYAKQGYGSPGAMYSSVDRLRVLQNADPFGDAWQVEMRKAKKQYYSGQMNRKERRSFERITEQHDKMRQPFPMHKRRFDANQIANPAEKHTNLSYNENVKAAANYSAPERLIGAVWEGACFGPSTPIETPTGNKAIRDVKVGDRVLSRDGEWNEVTATHERDVRDDESVVRLSAAGHSRRVLVTPNHEVMAAREKMCLCPKGPKESYPKHASSCEECRDRFEPKMIPVGELREGDYLAVRRPEFNQIEEFVFTEDDFDADHLNKVDGWWYASKHPKRCKYGVPERIDGDELGAFYEILGWYLAEGSIHTERQVTFTLHADEKDYAHRIERLVESVFDTNVRHVTDRFGDKKVRLVRVGSKTLARFFRRFGKQQGKHLPQEYIPDSPQLLKRLLKGFYLGDGYFQHKGDGSGAVRINQCAPGVSNPIRHILMRLGMAPSQGKYHNGERKDGSVKWHYDVSVYGDDASKLWEICKEEEPPFRVETGKQGTLFNVDGKFVLYRIEHYKVGKQTDTVYDLTVNGDPSYTTSIVTAHNSSLRTPLHTKFFGNYTPMEQYERKVLLERDFQSWEDPVDDFVKPYAHGLGAADNPAQGATSFALGGAIFGNPAIGAAAGVIGAAYGGARGAYESMGGSDYIPEKIQNVREAEQRLDRVRYHRAKKLYDATGSQEYLDEMQSTATGWTKEGMSGTGWAKNRRRSYAPANRNDSELYGTDRGFGSPYRGLKKIEDFSSALMKHDGKVLEVGEQTAKAALQRTDRAAVSARTVSKGTSAMNREGADRAQQLLRRTAREAGEQRSNAYQQFSGGGRRITGMSESGFAKKLRSENTQVASSRGFGSPFRGDDPERAINYRARDPVQQELPPELLTAFKAAPQTERDFVRPFLQTQNPDRQAEILQTVSPDMAAMMETGWNYLYGRQMSDRVAETTPNEQLEADLTAHPVMGLGAEMESYEIATVEDMGIDAKDADLGWQGAMERAEGALVEPSAIESVQDLTRQSGVSAQELRQIVRTALLQMGVDAKVSVQGIAGPSEIHVREST